MQRPGLGEPKTLLELHLAMDVKVHKRGCCKYMRSKRKTRENVGQLLSEVGALETQDMLGLSC